MKTTQLIFLLLFVSISSFAQESRENSESTKAENFSAKTGILIQKTFTDIGEWKRVAVQRVSYKDLVTNQTVNSVRLEYTPTGQYATSKKAVLDIDEVDDLLKAFEFLIEMIETTSPEKYTEVTFRSVGGFETGCFFSKGKWSPYLKLKASDSKSYVFLKQEDIVKFAELFKKSIPSEV